MTNLFTDGDRDVDAGRGTCGKCGKEGAVVEFSYWFDKGPFEFGAFCPDCLRGFATAAESTLTTEDDNEVQS